MPYTVDYKELLKEIISKLDSLSEELSGNLNYLLNLYLRAKASELYGYYLVKALF